MDESMGYAVPFLHNRGPHWKQTELQNRFLESTSLATEGQWRWRWSKAMQILLHPPRANLGEPIAPCEYDLYWGTISWKGPLLFTKKPTHCIPQSVAARWQSPTCLLHGYLKKHLYIFWQKSIWDKWDNTILYSREEAPADQRSSDRQWRPRQGAMGSPRLARGGWRRICMAFDHLHLQINKI